MDDKRWTIPQALTWIIYRDRDRVHGVREKKNPVSCMDVLNEAIREADEDQELQRCFAARDEFVAKLKSGQVEFRP
jgi:hypothetical protein